MIGTGEGRAEDDLLVALLGGAGDNQIVKAPLRAGALFRQVMWARLKATLGSIFARR